MNARATIHFMLNGNPTQALAGETILQVAKREGIAVPHLCYKVGLNPDGNCRACVVEIEGERVLAPSCCWQASAGMNVATQSPRALAAQKGVLQLLLSEANISQESSNSNFASALPAAQLNDTNELRDWAAKLNISELPYPRRESIPVDNSHPAITVNLDACIQCTRCLRACRETQVNDVIGMAGRGAQSRIVFDFDDPMGASTCVGCGECVQACPTGALSNKSSDEIAPQVSSLPAQKIPSLCPYCGVGCQLDFHVENNQIKAVSGRDGPANAGRLCVKGRYGFDYVHHPDRLTEPLIRIKSKQAKFAAVPSDWRSHYREASWEEALALAGGNLKQLRDSHGANSLAGFGSAKGSNEEAYLFQKLVRLGFGTNNVDHCTRLCHASSVTALLEGMGSAAVSNPVRDVEFAEVIFIIGANPTVNHPVAATWIKNAIKRGAKLIIADPRRTELARFATHVLQFKADSDVALLNALLHVIIEENLVDEKFISQRTENYEALKANVAAFSPEAMSEICGIPAAQIREVARLYATAKAAMILWGMGVSQHIHGTDNARCLIALALCTGQIGKPGAGLHPLRGQNNVQGASDVGLIPMMLPDYQRVNQPQSRERFEKLWGATLDPTPGLTVVEILKAIDAGKIKGMYIMGENPAMSDPDAQHARASLAALETLVVQDIFMTETAWLADVVLPASAFPEKTGTFTNTDRLVQLGRKAIEPPGNARHDLWIINEMGKQLGLDWRYGHPREVFEEMRKGMDSLAGISWVRLEDEGAVTYPCANEDEAGQSVVFINDFPTDSARAKFVPAGLISAAEQPDAQYPFVLITGRQLEHWHTGSMTRRAVILDALEPSATANLHPDDLQALNCAAGNTIKVTSRRGTITLIARADAGTPRGSLFIPFAYAEAAANLLTNSALDPLGKIPEFKYCAVAIHKVS